MATQLKKKKVNKTTAKKVVATKTTQKKSQFKAKEVVKPMLKTAPPPKPVQKVHPFAQFMKGRISNHYSSAPMSKFNDHNLYRKKAV